MLEELGLTEEEFEKLGNACFKLSEESVKDGQIIRTDDEMFLALAKLPISISKIKFAASKIRVKAVSFVTNILKEILLTNLPEENSELVKQLHNGDQTAFLVILHLVKTELIASFLPKLGKDISTEHLAKFFNPEVKQYICLAAACILSGVPSAANANIEMAFVKLFQLFKIYEMTDKVLHKEGELKRASDTSKKANKTRHAKNNMIRAHAIKLYEQGSFPSVRNAARKLAPVIMEYAENAEELKDIEGTDKRFDCIIQTADTIERWLGTFKKEQKAKV